jgi:uncharacterized membrane protein
VLIRAIMGAFIGTMGSFVTFTAGIVLAWSICPPESECTTDAREWADTAFWLGLAGGLTVMALLYAGLLKLSRQPRPRSVVVPSLVLSAVVFAIPGTLQLKSALYLPAATFAAAGLITGFGPWREILRRRPW